ncbi:unnamed protein product [Brachionus calyciflorus]|uniref:BTB domain-containing protein n=1 Tax=Brachionus calyciflorus TaxID=104777 RepID=A0A813ZBE7_9BILA|nr:unnamed protein product [Brachionus calyciflorus]
MKIISIEQKLSLLTHKIDKLSQDYSNLLVDLNQNVIKTEQQIRSSNIKQPKKIQLNIGGKLFVTTQRTLEKSQYFKDYFSRNYCDMNNEIFIDRDPKLFEYILHYLRRIEYNEVLEVSGSIDLNQLNKEAKFYKIPQLIDLTNQKFNFNIDFKNIIIIILLIFQVFLTAKILFSIDEFTFFKALKQKKF